MGKNYKEKILKRINKGKKVKTPIFIENSPEDFTVIYHEGDFKMIPLPELTIKDKQNINKFMEEFLKISKDLIKINEIKEN